MARQKCERQRRYIQVDLEESCSLSGDARLTDSLHFFNSFFYKKLTEKIEPPDPLNKHAINHERVRKWTKVFSAYFSYKINQWILFFANRSCLLSLNYLK